MAAYLAKPAQSFSDERNGRGVSLLCGRVSEGDAFLNVPLEALGAGLQQRLLLVGDVSKDIDRLLGAIGLETMLERLQPGRS